MSDAISDFADIITVIFSKCLSWVSLVIDTIEEEPLLLLCILIPFVSIGIGLLKKLLTVKS